MKTKTHLLLEATLQLVLDILIVTINSVVYMCESLVKTVLPDSWRGLKDLSGQVVLITGGGGSIGRRLALNFARQKAKVIIWDVNETAINSTLELLKTSGYEDCEGYVVDISNRHEVYQMARKLQSDRNSSDVSILVNNAAIVSCQPFWSLSDEAIADTYNTNILSHYWLLKAFLPRMMERNRGHIVTVSSVTGLIGTYGCTDYSATKYACVGLHESLFTELRTHGYDGIDLTLICPYYVNTSLFAGVQPRFLPMLEPQYVADRIVQAVRKQEIWCILPGNVRIVVALKCVLPAKLCWLLMSRLVRGPESMMQFHGGNKVATLEAVSSENLLQTKE